MFRDPKTSGHQAGLEVVSAGYSDLEVPVSHDPELRYSKQTGLYPMLPERPKSWLRRQIARKRVIAAIVVVLVLAVVGIAVGFTVGKKHSAASPPHPSSSSLPDSTTTQHKDS
ncbi:hypothetical protein K440DRAFT_613354, partial [Wilcoxina mikolae CBS 423.85]